MLSSVFERLFPPAYYLRLPDLKNHVTTAPYQEHTRYNMMYLVNAIEETASVDKALGTLRWEDAKKKELLGRFYKLGISPIPLRKNFCADRLPNPTLLLLKLARDGRVEVKYMWSK